MLNEFRWTPISDQRNLVLRSYEPVQPYFFRELVRWYEATVFLDVGANIGSYCIPMTNVSTIRVAHAFEPSPATFCELESNIALNLLRDRVVAHQLALSSAPGEAQFAIVGKFSGANGLRETQIHSDRVEGELITVRVDLLDRVLKSSSLLSSDLIAAKIDVEGHEKLVIEGAREVIASHEMILQVEHYDGSGRGTAAEVGFLLGRLGFSEIWRIGPDRYYVKSSRAPSNSDLLDIVAAAHSAMIEDFKRYSPEAPPGGSSAIHRTLFRDVSVSIGGRTAASLRGLRSRLFGAY